MQTVLVQGGGQDGPDLVQQLGVAFNRSETTDDFLVVLQEATGVSEVFRHGRKCGSNRDITDGMSRSR